MADSEQDFAKWQNELIRQQADMIVDLFRDRTALAVAAYEASRTTKGYPQAYMERLHKVLAQPRIKKALRAEGIELEEEEEESA